MTSEQDQSKGTATLSSKLKRGVVWRYTETAFNTVFTFGTGIILARLLDPNDFGVFAAATAFINILLLQVRFGWAAGLLRTRKLEEPLLSSVFWFMQATALLNALLVVLGARWLSRFYSDSRFIIIMVLLCAYFFISPFNAINGSLLKWRMRYDVTSRLSLTAQLLSTSAGVIAAFLGMGVYSLILGGILGPLLGTIFYAVYAPWRPRLIFSWQSIRPVFAFSWRLHLNNTLNMIANRIDNMLVGGLTSVASLGLYVKAFSLGRMPIDLLGTNLYEILYTALSRMEDQPSQSILMFQKILGALTFATYYPLLLLILVGDGLVVTLYGEKWVGTVIPMQIMAAGSFFVMISMMCGMFSDAQNLVKKETKVQIINLIWIVAAVFIGSQWGLIGIAAAISMRAPVMVCLMKNVLKQKLDLTWRNLLHPVWPVLVATMSALGTGWVTIHSFGNTYSPRSLLHIGLVASVAAFAYLGSWLLIARMLPAHAPISAVVDLIKSAIRKFVPSKSKVRPGIQSSK